MSLNVLQGISPSLKLRSFLDRNSCPFLSLLLRGAIEGPGASETEPLVVDFPVLSVVVFDVVGCVEVVGASVVVDGSVVDVFGVVVGSVVDVVVGSVVDVFGVVVGSVVDAFGVVVGSVVVGAAVVVAFVVVVDGPGGWVVGADVDVGLSVFCDVGELAVVGDGATVVVAKSSIAAERPSRFVFIVSTSSWMAPRTSNPSFASSFEPFIEPFRRAAEPRTEPENRQLDSVPRRDTA